MYKATGFTLESLGVKQQCLHCCGKVKLNKLAHSKQPQEAYLGYFPAKTACERLANPAYEDGTTTKNPQKGSMGEMYSWAHMGKGNTWYK